MTTLLFVVMGISFLLSERTTIGIVVLGLGLLRGAAAARQWQHAFAPEEEE